MLARLLPWIAGTAMAAALVLTGVAMIQTLRLKDLRPQGIRAQATVMIVDLRAPDREQPWASGSVRLFVSDDEAGTFATNVPHPPASLTELWPGALVDVAVLPGDPPQVAFWPVLPERRQRAVWIALAFTLALAAGSGLASRFLKDR